MYDLPAILGSILGYREGLVLLLILQVCLYAVIVLRAMQFLYFSVQVLHLYWFWLVMVTSMKLLRGERVGNDARSDSELSSCSQQDSDC